MPPPFFAEAMMGGQKPDRRLPKWAGWVTLVLGAAPYVVLLIDMTPWRGLLEDSPVALLYPIAIWLCPLLAFAAYLFVKQFGQSSRKNAVGAILAVAWLVIIALLKNLVPR
jgi:hypothetical protein